jgi:hypothetical protein
MEKSSGLTKYMNGPVGNVKPKRNNTPWESEEVKELCKEASAFLKNDGDPNFAFLALKFNRTEGAVKIKLSKEGWYKAHGMGQNHSAKEGTLKTQILDYVKNNPWCFSKDVNKTLNVRSTSTLSTLTKEGELKRIRHRGNGAYLYCFNDVTVEDLAKEVINEFEPVVAKPIGKAEGKRRIIKPTSDTFMSKIRRLFGRT